MVRTHTVVAGETLTALALRYYGDAELYRLIATASGITNPNVINVGQHLVMPDYARYTAVASCTMKPHPPKFSVTMSSNSLSPACSGKYTASSRPMIPRNEGSRER